MITKILSKKPSYPLNLLIIYNNLNEVRGLETIINHKRRRKDEYSHFVSLNLLLVYVMKNDVSFDSFRQHIVSTIT